MEKERLVIIGCGPAGLTAAIYAARASLSPLVISGQLPGGLLTQTGEVENFPGFEEGISGYELMDKIEDRYGEQYDKEDFIFNNIDVFELYNYYQELH